MREFAIFNINYEEGLEFINEMKHQDINTLKLNVEEYNAIVKLYTNLLSQTRNFEYEHWLDDSNLTVALLVKDAMITLNALYRILENGNLHIRIFRAVERIARAMTTSKVEYH